MEYAVLSNSYSKSRACHICNPTIIVGKEYKKTETFTESMKFISFFGGLI